MPLCARLGFRSPDSPKPRIRCGAWEHFGFGERWFRPHGSFEPRDWLRGTGAGPDAGLTWCRQAPRESLPVVSGGEAAASRRGIRGCSGRECPVPHPAPFGELGLRGEVGSRGAARPGRERERGQQPSPRSQTPGCLERLPCFRALTHPSPHPARHSNPSLQSAQPLLTCPLHFPAVT